MITAMVSIATNLLLRAGLGPRHVGHFSLEIAFKSLGPIAPKSQDDKYSSQSPLRKIVQSEH